MKPIELQKSGDYFHFEEGAARALGKELAAEYRQAEPFPHIVLEGFLPGDLLMQVHAAYPSPEGKRAFNRDQERMKYQYHPSESASPIVRNLLAELNSSAFLAFLEEMTGIEGLVSDPYYHGGGLHEILAGGHLSVHADFNVHSKMKLERRLNLLVYLNDDWSPEYGGDLELWEKDMSRCSVKVAPKLGTAVIFSTNSDSYHGHPDPLACPPDRSRRSIATYYYTAFADGYGSVPERTTVFQPRPGTADRTDWKVKTLHFINDWVPHKLQRAARRITRV